VDSSHAINPDDWTLIGLTFLAFLLFRKRYILIVRTVPHYWSFGDLLQVASGVLQNTGRFQVHLTGVVEAF
jgi:hypothetical protein